MVGAKRTSKWATAAEIRPAANKKKNNKCDIWKSDVPSDQADFGWGDGKLRECSGYEYQLADWDGSWAPPPVDWDGSWAPPPVDWSDRERFHDRRFQERMDDWVKKVNLTPEPIKCTETEFGGVDGEIAPYAWIPTEIDGTSPEYWWADHMKSPEAESGTHPWWNTYASPTSEALARVTVPNAKLDIMDNDMTKTLKTAKQAIVELNNKRLRRAENFRKIQEERRAAAIVAANYHPPPNQYASRLNIYLRPANGHDIAQITEIYNHYIQNTIFCPEMTALSTIQVRERWTDVNNIKLPFLVAVDCSSKGNRKKGPGGVSAATQNEPIVGFAFADDYNDIRGMYRYVVKSRSL